MKVKLSNFEVRQRSKTLPKGVRSVAEIFVEAVKVNLSAPKFPRQLVKKPKFSTFESSFGPRLP